MSDVAADEIPPWAILHVPHASTVIPPDLRPQFLLSDAALSAEIARMTDHATDRLFGAGWPSAQIARAPLSRLVVDVERFEDDAGEPMACRGMGVIYARTSDDQPLRRLLDADEREALLDRVYRPHHRRLAAMVGAAIEQFELALIIDAHSYPCRPLPYEDSALDRPEICIGTDSVHTPKAVVDALVAAFAAQGFRVGIDTPFAGALVPAAFHRVDPRCRSVMIEVRRDLYADDDGQCRPQAFEAMRAAIRSSLPAVFRQAAR